MTERPWMTACRWLLVSVLAAFCLRESACTASAYLGCAGDGDLYTDCWREAARNAPGRRIALLCKDASALSPMDRARLAAISWERVPMAPVTVDGSSDLQPFDSVLSFSWLSAADEQRLKDGGFSLVASNRHAKTWGRSDAGPLVPTQPSVAPPVVRECLALTAEFLLLLLCCRALAGRAPLGLRPFAVVAALVVASLLGCIALNHTLLEPNGLGTYGGKAKLLYLSGGLPGAYFGTVGANALQPSYPPGLTLLACFHFLLSGGCGDRLVQLLGVFAMAMICIGLLCRGIDLRCSPAIALYLLSPVSIRMTSGFYAEPFAALTLLVGWGMIGRGRPLAGASVLGLAGMFRPEAGLVAVAFALGGCPGAGVKRSMMMVLVSAVPSLAWMVFVRVLGCGGVPDWDFLAIPRFSQMAVALLREVRFIGVTALPVALILYLVRPLHRPRIGREALAALLPAVVLLVLIPMACGFHTSSHADWMMENTIPRLAWYVLVVPLGALSRGMSTQEGRSIRGLFP